ncbi:hypothetical protein KR018_003038, partial [Drosophila ironensis]
WSEEALKAFELLKNNLISSPILITPNFEEPFILLCDASSYGIGSVLAQKRDGIELPIAFMSEKLTKAQKNYSVSELECLAVLKGIKKFRPYIEGQQFSVVTDHASLKWLMKQKDLSGRLARWSMKLQGFNFEILHRKGTQNVVADTLSRQLEAEIEEFDFEGPIVNLESEHFKTAEYRD